MLAFIRGGNPFIGSGEVYLKQLPDGEPIRLTHDDHPKMGLAFSLDGSKISFTRGVGSEGQHGRCRSQAANHPNYCPMPPL